MNIFFPDRAFHRQRHLLEHNAIVHKAVHLAIRYTQLFESRGCTSFNWNYYIYIDLKSLTRMRPRYTVIQSYGVRYQISPNISLSSFFLSRTFVFLFRNNDKFFIPVFIIRKFEHCLILINRLGNLKVTCPRKKWLTGPSAKALRYN